MLIKLSFGYLLDKLAKHKNNDTVIALAQDD